MLLQHRCNTREALLLFLLRLLSTVQFSSVQFSSQTRALFVIVIGDSSAAGIDIVEEEPPEQAALLD